MYRLGEALAALGEKLPGAQAEAGALRLVEAMAATTDGDQLNRLAQALAALGDKLPGAQAEAGALRLVAAMAAVEVPYALVRLGERLGSIHPPSNPGKLETAPDLLQAPMAYGETLEHLHGIERKQDLAVFVSAQQTRNQQDRDVPVHGLHIPPHPAGGPANRHRPGAGWSLKLDHSPMKLS